MSERRTEFPIDGFVASGFEPVREAFIENFKARGEIGAACAAFVDGEIVVDLWGGYQNPIKCDRIWKHDTLVPVYSASKGISSLAIAILHSQGLFDYNQPVKDIWPAFSQAGKSDITIRQLLGHQAGLAAIDRPLTPASFADFDELADLLAMQRPQWRDRSRHGYHAISIGLYQNELTRRVDPLNRTIGKILADLRQRLDLEIYIGLPNNIDKDRIADVKTGTRKDMFKALRTLTPAFVFTSSVPGNITYRTFRNPKMKSGAEVTQRPWINLELPAVNGVISARSAAKFYGIFANGGRELNLKTETLQCLEADPNSRKIYNYKDVVLRTDTKFSLGFWKPYPGYPFGSDSRAYGSPGAGGSMAFADPSTKLGFAYAPNRLGLYMWNDPREAALREAIYRALGNLTPPEMRFGPVQAIGV